LIDIRHIIVKILFNLVILFFLFSFQAAAALFEFSTKEGLLQSLLLEFATREMLGHTSQELSGGSEEQREF
jgi:hypothetical protein